MRCFSNLSPIVISGFLLLSFGVQAQIEHGGEPLSLSRALVAPAGIRTPLVDVTALAAQDAVNDLDKSIPYRFGVNHATDLDLANSGTWTTLEDGQRLWRLGIECPGALSVNFEFHDFRPATGAKVFVIDEQGDHIGAFTRANDHGDHVLGVQAVKGSRIIIEYQVPAIGPIGALRIGQVTHGYRDIFGYARALGSSGSCNNNVICPEGDPWRDQIRSVAIITVNGSGICTGTLINNCAEDGMPYFLTANHCLPGNLNVSTWVFRFNWDSPSCTQNLNGPTNQTVSGASLLVNSGGSDVALLQLNSTPPASYNVFYSGWDRSGAISTGQTAIHHPSGDVKKISFDVGSTSAATFGSAQCWRISSWEDGTTEPGSSGSGLWDSNKRLIGQLYGGSATCSNNINDYYGRFDISYPLLAAWLGNCGNTLDGYDPNVANFNVDAQASGISGLAGSICDPLRNPVVTVRNAGSDPLTSCSMIWSISNGPNGSVPWSGNLASGASTTVALGSVTLPEGSNTFTVTIGSPNGGADQNPSNNQATGPVSYGSVPISFDLTLDRYGAETSWKIENGSTVFASGGPYTTVGTNGAYPQATVDVCVPVGCYDMIVLDSFGDGLCCAYGNGAYALTDAQNNVLASGGTFLFGDTTNFCVPSQAQVQLSAQVLLEGPLDVATGIMSDALRSAGMVPSSEPYTTLLFAQVGSGGETVQANVLNVTGSNAIVDWVLLELRTGAPAYTVVATRCALLQRDGDVVDMDGISPVQFPVAQGTYHVSIRHRNHMGVMSAAAIPLSATTTVLDLRSAQTATYGTQALRAVGAFRAMWAGNVVNDGQVQYTGTGNDRDPILSRIGGTVATNTTAGYHVTDVNMDGSARYTGTGNDRDVILVNIGGTVATAVREEQLP